MEPSTKPSRSRPSGTRCAPRPRCARPVVLTSSGPGRERSPFDSTRGPCFELSGARCGSSGAQCPHTSPRGRRVCLDTLATARGGSKIGDFRHHERAPLSRTISSAKAPARFLVPEPAGQATALGPGARAEALVAECRACRGTPSPVPRGVAAGTRGRAGQQCAFTDYPLADSKGDRSARGLR
jgi:hypothetical protein